MWIILVTQNFLHSGSCWLHFPGVFSCASLFSAFPVNGRAVGLIRFWFNSSGKNSSWILHVYFALHLLKRLMHFCWLRCWPMGCQLAPAPKKLFTNPSPKCPSTYWGLLPRSIISWRIMFLSELASTQGYDPWFYRVLSSLWLSVGRFGVGEGQKQQRTTEQQEAFMIDDVFLSNCQSLYVMQRMFFKSSGFRKWWGPVFLLLLPMQEDTSVTWTQTQVTHLCKLDCWVILLNDVIQLPAPCSRTGSSQ